MIMRYSILLFLLLGLCMIFPLSAQQKSENSIELNWDETHIGKSIHAVIVHPMGHFQLGYGIRFHLRKRPSHGQLFVHTMHPFSWAQQFGPVFFFDYMIPAKHWIARPFIGYHTQLGVMGRRLQLTYDQISTGTWESFETESPLYHWENQLIAGAYFSLAESVEVKLYGGVGIAGIFNIDSRYSPFDRSTHQLGYQIGGGISHKLGK